MKLQSKVEGSPTLLSPALLPAPRSHVTILHNSSVTSKPLRCMWGGGMCVFGVCLWCVCLWCVCGVCVVVGCHCRSPPVTLSWRLLWPRPSSPQFRTPSNQHPALRLYVASRITT